jgi:hypothetical protein
MLDIEIISAIQSRIKRRGNFVSTLEEDWKEFKETEQFQLARLTREEIKSHAEVQQIDRSTLKMLHDRQRMAKANSKLYSENWALRHELIEARQEVLALKRVG